MTPQVPTFKSGAGKTELNVTNGLWPHVRYSRFYFRYFILKLNIITSAWHKF